MDVLATALGCDPLAPLYVLRLWSWCQNRKSWQFPDLTASALRGICKAQHEPELLIEAMVSAGYVERMGAGFSSSAWATLNAQLIAAWTNGKNGGRPKKAVETVGLTDKKREEKKQPRSAPTGATPPPSPPAPPAEPPKPPPAPTPPPPPPAPAPAASAPPAAVPRGRSLFGDDDGDGAPPKKRTKVAATPAEVERPEWFPLTVWNEFLAYRLEYAKKNKAAPFSAPAIKGSIRYFDECRSKGEEPEAAFLRMAAMGWRVPFPERTFGGSNGAQRVTSNDRNAAAGAALAGFSRPQPERASRHGTHIEDAEDVEYRDAPRSTE